MVGTRRAVLLAAPALALSACGKAAETPQEDPNVDTGTQKQGDVDLLEGLIDAERPLRTVLLNAGPPARAERPLLAAMRADTERQGDTLREAIRALGGKPSPAVVNQPGTTFEPAQVLPQQQQLVATYLDFIPKLSDGRVRELAAGILAEKAARLAQLRVLLDEPPVPEAFVA